MAKDKKGGFGTRLKNEGVPATLWGVGVAAPTVVLAQAGTIFLAKKLESKAMWVKLGSAALQLGLAFPAGAYSRTLGLALGASSGITVLMTLLEKVIGSGLDGLGRIDRTIAKRVFANGPGLYTLNSNGREVYYDGRNVRYTDRQQSGVSGYQQGKVVGGSKTYALS